MAIEAYFRLIPYLERKLGGTDLRIKDAWQNTEGWSMETFSLTLEYTKDSARIEQSIILRRQPISGLLEPYDASTEYRVLDALQPAGVAIPKTFWLAQGILARHRSWEVGLTVLGPVTS